ncbi:dUTP diphosphatase [Desulfatiferula olefinivorans]
MNTAPLIQFVKIDPDTDRDIPLPRYMTEEAAGMDVCIAIREDLILEPGRIALLPTGFKMAMPKGFEAQIRPRSGLAVRHGIGLINSPGTVDSDYRGEVKLAVINLGEGPFTFRRGDRVAQMVIAPVVRARIQAVETLADTDRNDGGFGHTGIGRTAP